MWEKRATIVINMKPFGHSSAETYGFCFSHNRIISLMESVREKIENF
jgi:hypothetical protein